MITGATLMTPGACFIPAPVRLARATVRFAPSGTPHDPGPDDSAPASVPQSRRGAEGADAPVSSGPVSAHEVEPGASHAVEPSALDSSA
jgi:hypothetical protein